MVMFVDLVPFLSGCSFESILLIYRVDVVAHSSCICALVSLLVFGFANLKLFC